LLEALVNSEAPFFRDLPRAWGELGRSRQMLIGGLGAVIVAGVLAAVLYAQRPQQTALYSNLNEQDAATIVGKLKDLKVPYTVSEGGGTISVPQEQAADLRLQLAGAGLPSGSGVGMVGMEVFDRNNLGITDFAQKLNYQRALEGELARTITRLSAVETARVHLALPQERLFTSQQRDATASVVIKPKPGARLTDEQVSSVKFLVSKGVEGLKTENVAVVDVNGTALGKLETSEMARDKQAATRLEIQRQREAELETKIQSMLTQVVGANRAVVRANVALDWNEVKQNIETYSPGTTQPQVLSERDRREQFTGRGAEAVAPGGVPGTQSNIPTYQLVAGAGEGGESSYIASDVTRNFQVSSDKQDIVRAPGEVKNIGIAVMVDQSVGANQVDLITQVVTAAAGIQPQRGDQVSVVTLPFDTTLSQQLKQQQEEQTLMDYVSLAFRVGGVLVGLGGLFLLFRMMSNAVRPKQPVLTVTEPLALPGGSAGLLPSARMEEQLAEALQLTGAVPARSVLESQIREEVRAELEARYETEAAASRREAEVMLAQSEATRREHMRENVTKLALTKPEALAEVLTNWLDQGGTAAEIARSTAGSRAS
jgi:flagellar M-ring protein FliF